jgi:hypothetical protein
MVENGEIKQDKQKDYLLQFDYAVNKLRQMYEDKKNLPLVGEPLAVVLFTNGNGFAHVCPDVCWFNDDCLATCLKEYGKQIQEDVDARKKDME